LYCSHAKEIKEDLKISLNNKQKLLWQLADKEKFNSKKMTKARLGLMP